MNTFQMRKELEEAGVKFRVAFSKISDAKFHVAELDGQMVDSDKRLGELVQRIYKKLGG